MFLVKLKHHSSIASISQREDGRGPCADPEGGGQGVRTPHEKSQKYRFHINTGPDPLKKHKATKPAFNVGPSSARQRKAI